MTNTRVLFIDRKSKELDKNKIAVEVSKAGNNDHGSNDNLYTNGLACLVDVEFSDVAEIRLLHPTKKHYLAQLKVIDGQSYYLKVRDQLWINSLRDLIAEVRANNYHGKFTKNSFTLCIYIIFSFVC